MTRNEDIISVESKFRLIQRYHDESNDTNDSSSSAILGDASLEDYEDDNTPHLRSTIRFEDIAGEEPKQRFRELCIACRSGDLEQVDQLVSIGTNINAIDEWDYSPLILASLCGHEPVVLYLLEHGAVCDRDTFQGERCLYGALNDSIRQLLLKFDISKAVDTTQPFAAHISQLLNKGYPKMQDVVFETMDAGTEKVQGYRALSNRFQLHKFILAARSDYFRDNLLGRWSQKSYIKFSSAMDTNAFQHVVRYLYLYDSHLNHVSSDMKLSMIKIAKSLKLNELVKIIENNIAETSRANAPEKEDTVVIQRLIRQQRQTDLIKARMDFELFFEKNVLSNMIVVKKADLDLMTPKVKAQLTQLKFSAAFPDVFVKVDIDHEEDEDGKGLGDKEPMVAIYPVHKAMLIRAGYYNTMFSSSFSEGQDDEKTEIERENKVVEDNDDISEAESNENLPILHFESNSIKVTEVVLGYLYTDNVSHIPLEYAIDVLLAADVLFIDRLKTLACIAIEKSEAYLVAAEDGDIEFSQMMFDILRVGWLTGMERLEKFVAKIMANSLDRFINDVGFKNLIVESSQRIANRQETDTIELIDDIRYYLAKKFGILMEADEDMLDIDAKTKKVIDYNDSPHDESGSASTISVYEQKYNHELDLIEIVLAELGLDA